MENHGAGKGDKYRPVDMKTYGENYDRIFGKKGTDATAGIDKRVSGKQQRGSGVVKGDHPAG